jgi:hypothetical protein
MGSALPVTFCRSSGRAVKVHGSLECPSAARNLRPMTEEEAAGIARFGDLIRYAPAIQKLAAS